MHKWMTFGVTVTSLALRVTVAPAKTTKKNASCREENPLDVQERQAGVITPAALAALSVNASTGWIRTIWGWPLHPAARPSKEGPIACNSMDGNTQYIYGEERLEKLCAERIR